MKKIFSTIWHVWALIGIILLTILWALFASACFILFNKTSDRLMFSTFKFATRYYAITVLIWMGIYVKTTWKYKPKKKENLIVIANHTSFLDIYALFATYPGVITFMGKKEFSKLPIFGHIYKRMIVNVDRKSKESRLQSLQESKDWLAGGRSLCLYPEGGIPKADTILAPFKKGAFTLAKDTDVPIISVLTPDNKEAFPYSITKGHPGVIRIVYNTPIRIDDSKPLNQWIDDTHQQMVDELNTLKRKK